MAEGYMALELMYLEERVRNLERRVDRRRLRDNEDPFDIPVNEFMDTYRLSQECALDLIAQIRAPLQRERLTGLTPEIQVLATLQFYAQGSYQSGVGNQAFNYMSQTSVSRCIGAVTNAINQRLFRQHVRFPMTAAERDAARAKFRHAPQPFEGAIGAIDCTYINILGPTIHEEAFVNHHGKHSLNVQAIVDPDLMILNINARFPGARNDSYIWSASPIRTAMEYHYNRGERQTWLLGDAAYPLEPWLMTPLAHYPRGTRQYRYTHQHCQARNVVERFFGLFKSVWRCLSYQRVLMYEPALSGRIVNACAALHNMRLRYRLPVDEFFDANHAGGPEPVQQANNARNAGQQVLENGDGDIQVRRGRGRCGPLAVAVRIQRQILAARYPNLPDGDAEAAAE